MEMLLEPISLIDRAENIVLMLVSWRVNVAAILGNLLVIRVFVVTLVDLLHHFASTKVVVSNTVVKVLEFSLVVYKILILIAIEARMNISSSLSYTLAIMDLVHLVGVHEVLVREYLIDVFVCSVVAHRKLLEMDSLLNTFV